MSLFVVNRYLGDEEEDGVESKSQAKTILERINEQARLRKKLRTSGIHESEEVIDLLEETSVTPKKKSHKKSSKKHKQNEEDAPRDHSPLSKVKKRKRDDDENEEAEVISKKKLKTKKKKESERGLNGESDDFETKTNKHEVVENSADSSGSSEAIESPKHKKKKKTKEKSPLNKGVTLTLNGKAKKKVTKKKKVEKVESDDSGSSASSENEEDADEKKLPDGKAAADDGSDEEAKSHAGDEDTAEAMKEDDVQYGSHDFGGYTVLGEVRETHTNKVKRVLPDWLTKPSVVSADIRNSRVPLDQVQGLSDHLIEKLKENSVNDFFPVQADLIPAILRSSQPAYYTGIAGYRPHDICCSSPTGSGKTLAFVLPIVQALQSRVVCRIRALAVLPVRDLATQVYKVFQTYCQNTPLKVGLLTGQKTFASEQQALVKQGPRGLLCQKDIIIATPGRLVDHISKTPGFNLEHLRFLVIDEADRMMDEIKQDWLHHVETAFLQSENSKRNNFTSFQAPLTVRSAANMFIPPQKLLFSATLSQNPEKLQQLNLFQPKLFTSVMTAKKTSAPKVAMEGEEETGDPAPELSPANVEGEFVGKYTTPAGLSEFFIQCPASQRPLLILHFLHNLSFRQVLCFTNSVESAHRLYLVVKLFGGIEVQEFSSNLHSGRRAKVLKQFEAGKVNLLICSDAMARGMDVDNVHYVISYEPPPFIKTYIHRIGRTARAGRPGSAFTLLEKKEVHHFKKMLKGAGKEKINEHKATKSQLKKLVPQFEEALQKMAEILKSENEKKNKKKR